MFELEEILKNLSVYLFYRWGNQNSEKWMDLYKLTLLISNRSGVSIKAVYISAYHHVFSY